MAVAVLDLGRNAFHDAVHDSLGVDRSAPPSAVVAASLRRAASLRCPSTPSAIVTAVQKALAPLPYVDSPLIVETLDQLVALGDLVEVLEEHDGSRRRTLYLGPPRFVRRAAGDVLIVGQRPDDVPLLGDALTHRVVHTGHVRRIEAADEELIALLRDYGLEEISATRWLRHEEALPAADLVDAYRRVLREQPPSGKIDDLKLLDPARPAGYYRGRWRAPTVDDGGVFVARRSQRYGADLWSLVELRAGEHVRLLDLPAFTSSRGCDEAWRLQAAIDASEHQPQEAIVQPTGAGRIRIGLPSPPPRWLQRRWDLLGEPVDMKGALFAYEFSASDTRDEVDFVRNHLWMEVRTLSKDEIT